MIRLLLIIIIAILFIVSYFLRKSYVKICKVLAGENSPEALEIIFSKFIKTIFFLALLGFVFVLFNQLILSLIYIGVVLLASAVFSINLSKNIS